MEKEAAPRPAALAHDLNNLLQVVIGTLELLKRRGELSPEILEAGLKAARDAGQLADELIEATKKQRP